MALTDTNPQVVPQSPKDAPGNVSDGGLRCKDGHPLQLSCCVAGQGNTCPGAAPRRFHKDNAADVQQNNPYPPDRTAFCCRHMRAAESGSRLHRWPLRFSALCAARFRRPLPAPEEGACRLCSLVMERRKKTARPMSGRAGLRGVRFVRNTAPGSGAGHFQLCRLTLTARAMPPRMMTVHTTRRSVMASDRNMAPSTAVMIGMASWMMDMATRLYLGTTIYHRI